MSSPERNRNGLVTIHIFIYNPYGLSWEQNPNPTFFQDSDWSPRHRKARYYKIPQW